MCVLAAVYRKLDILSRRQDVGFERGAVMVAAAIMRDVEAAQIVADRTASPLTY